MQFAAFVSDKQRFWADCGKLRASLRTECIDWESWQWASCALPEIPLPCCLVGPAAWQCLKPKEDIEGSLRASLGIGELGGMERPGLRPFCAVLAWMKFSLSLAAPRKQLRCLFCMIQPNCGNGRGPSWFQQASVMTFFERQQQGAELTVWALARSLA